MPRLGFVVVVLWSLATTPVLAGEPTEAPLSSFTLTEDDDLAKLDAAQRAVWDAWIALLAGQDRDAPKPGEGDWQATITEASQSWAPGLRFFHTGGTHAGGHRWLPIQWAVQWDGEVRWIAQHEYAPQLSACTTALWPAYDALAERARTEGLVDAAFDAEEAKLFAARCRDLRPVLGAGLLERLEDRPLEPEVASFSGFMAAIVLGAESADVPLGGGPLPTSSDGPTPAPKAPRIVRSADGRVEASGQLGFSRSDGSGWGTFTLRVGTAELVFGVESHGGHFFVPY